MEDCFCFPAGSEGFFEQQGCSELMLVMLSHSRVVCVFLDVMSGICI